MLNEENGFDVENEPRHEIKIKKDRNKQMM